MQAAAPLLSGTKTIYRHQNSDPGPGAVAGQAMHIWIVLCATVCTTWGHDAPAEPRSLWWSFNRKCCEHEAMFGRRMCIVWRILCYDHQTHSHARTHMQTIAFIRLDSAEHASFQLDMLSSLTLTTPSRSDAPNALALAGRGLPRRRRGVAPLAQ